MKITRKNLEKLIEETIEELLESPESRTRDSISRKAKKINFGHGDLKKRPRSSMVRMKSAPSTPEEIKLAARIKQLWDAGTMEAVKEIEKMRKANKCEEHWKNARRDADPVLGPKGDDLAKIPFICYALDDQSDFYGQVDEHLSKNLQNLIKETTQEVLNEQGAAATLRKQIKDFQSRIPPNKRAEYNKEVKNLNLPKSGLLLSQLQDLAAIAKKYAFNPSKEGDRTATPPTKPSAPANSVDTILQNVTQRFKRANPQAIKKIIELQAMLVKLKVAPAKLKNGKPFVDGVFGRSTVTAISKLYR